jgi:hypothetical protein
MIVRVGRATLIVVLAGILVAAASAGSGQPQERHTKADMAMARKAALYTSDFQSGWKAMPSSQGDQSNPRCSTYNPNQSDLVETGKYDSPDFTLADGTFVSSSTGVFKTVQMARTGYVRVAVPALPACFGELFKKGITKPNAATILSTGPASFPRLGDRSNAYRLTASVTIGKTKLPVTIDLVLFNRSRVDVAMIFLGIGKPLPSTFEQALAARVAARAK